MGRIYAHRIALNRVSLDTVTVKIALPLTFFYLFLTCFIHIGR